MTTEIKKWEYQSAEGSPVAITMADVRGVLATTELVTDKEIVLFMEMCAARGINPWEKEAYLIKYSAKAPASMVVAKDYFTKRAEANGESDGWEAGITIEKDGEIQHIEGSAHYSGTLIGGWARVYKKNRRVPYYAEVTMSEYQQKGFDGKPKANWLSMPATMIRKVALVQALREAFPAEFGGLYSAEEMEGRNEPLKAAQAPVRKVEIEEEITYEVEAVDSQAEDTEPAQESDTAQVAAAGAGAESADAGIQRAKKIAKHIVPVGTYKGMEIGDFVKKHEASAEGFVKANLKGEYKVIAGEIAELIVIMKSVRMARQNEPVKAGKPVPFGNTEITFEEVEEEII